MKQEGRVKWFDAEKKHYGFIERDGKSDLFVHIHDVLNGNKAELKPGTPVRFEVEEKDSRSKAVLVEIIVT